MKSKGQKKSGPPILRLAVGAGALLLAGLAVYWPALRGEFIMDDILWIVNNPYLKSFHGLLHIWSATDLPDLLPLTSTSFWIEWQLWHLNPLGYHVTNVLLHVAGGILLWRVLRGLAIPGAWLAALLFVVHPVNVESVAWISERKNTLSMFFYLLSLLWWLRSERNSRAFYAFSLIAFLLALLSKTAVVMLPVVLLGCAWWQRGKIERRDWIRTLPFFALAVVWGLVTIWFQSHQGVGMGVVQTGNFWTRLAGAGCAVWFYLEKALWPQNLAFIYPRWIANGYLPTAAFIGLAVVLWCYRKTPWGRPMAFGLGYFVVMLLPVLGFVDNYYFLYSMVADHWQYFSIIGVIALVAGWICSNSTLQNLKLKVPLGAALAMVLSVMAWKQASLYASAEKLWRDTVEKNPGSWVAHNSLGHYLGNTPEAIAQFRAAINLNPNDVEPHVNLAAALLNTGQWDEAERELEMAKKLNPHAWAIWFDLGLLYGAQNKLAEAEAAYREAIRIEPGFATEHKNLGTILQKEGKEKEAETEFQKAQDLDRAVR